MLSPSSASVNVVIPTPSSATEPLDQQHELVKGVQRKPDMAMADLNKALSNPKVNDGSQRKRIKLSQISIFA